MTWSRWGWLLPGTVESTSASRSPGTSTTRRPLSGRRRPRRRKASAGSTSRYGLTSWLPGSTTTGTASGCRRAAASSHSARLPPSVRSPLTTTSSAPQAIASATRGPRAADRRRIAVGPALAAHGLEEPEGVQADVEVAHRRDPHPLRAGDGRSGGHRHPLGRRAGEGDLEDGGGGRREALDHDGAGPGVGRALDRCTGAAHDDRARAGAHPGDVTALADSGTVATLLPGVEFSTRQPWPDARRLIDAGVTVALACDCNPRAESSLSSMAFCIALAVRDMGMTPAEGAVVGHGRGWARPRPRRRRHDRTRRACRPGAARGPLGDPPRVPPGGTARGGGLAGRSPGLSEGSEVAAAGTSGVCPMSGPTSGEQCRPRQQHEE